MALEAPPLIEELLTGMCFKNDEGEYAQVIEGCNVILSLFCL